MRAMLFEKPKTPLSLKEVPEPVIESDELLVKILACGICRTDLHIYDGDLIPPKTPLILGHEIVGTVEKAGKNVSGIKVGDKVGIPWLASTCGHCEFCVTGRENLCDHAQFTGFHVQGGFAEYTKCKGAFAVKLSLNLNDLAMAPLLCAGLIGFRSYQKAAAEKTLGFYGFGAAAHLLLQLALFEKKEVYAFTRPGDAEGQAFAKQLGAVWAGDSTAAAPVLLDAAIIFAPDGSLVPLCLKGLKKGGRCVCGGIHMSDISSFPYKDLWGEKIIASITNLTRHDAQQFFSLCEQFHPKPTVTEFSLEQVNDAIGALKKGQLHGAAVIRFL